MSNRTTNYFTITMLKQDKETCGTFHNVTALSIFSAVASFVIALPTILINLMILHGIYFARKKSKAKYKIFFYKLLVNIAFADFLKGILAGSSSVIFHVKESIGYTEDISIDAPIVHLTLLVTDSAALVSVTILSIDRIISLFFPVLYRAGLSRKKENFVLISTWPLAFLIVSPYFKLNYIRELAVFAGITISVTVISLIVLTVTSHYKFYARKTRNLSFSLSDEKDWQKQPKVHHPKSPDNLRKTILNNKLGKRGVIQQTYSGESFSSIQSSSSQAFMIKVKTMDENVDSNEEDIKKDIDGDSSSSSNPAPNLLVLPSDKPFEVASPSKKYACKTASVKSDLRKRITGSIKREKAMVSVLEKRVTRTFVKMLIVFLSTYLPIAVMIVYMNLSDNSYVNCVVRHALRDSTVLFIIASSLCRGINFIVSLRHLRKYVKGFCKCD